MEPKILSQPAWVNDVKLLQTALFNILGGITEQTHLNAFFDETALNNYWIPAFTHKSVNPDPQKNYETLEFYGDKVMNDTFSSYIRKRFNNRINQEKATLLQNRYMFKGFQAELSEKLKLPELVRFDPEYPDINKSIKEDVLEAFFGSLKNLGDDRIMMGVGYIYCFNLITKIFNEIPIVLEDVQKDSITLLKELFDKLGWGAVKYDYSDSDYPQLGKKKAIVSNEKTNTLLGVGYGPDQPDAKAAAAQNALEKLNKEGITQEYAEENILERQRTLKPEFDKQYLRVQEAIKVLNKESQKRGKVQIRDFKIVAVESHEVTGGRRYTFGINVEYQEPNGKVAWKIIDKWTGNSQDSAKIELMKRFANAHNVP
jgi:dsRNA-specific ribonuclease